MSRGTLLSFVGNHDPYSPDSAEPGTILSLLMERPFSRAYLFCTGPAYFERAKSVEAAAAETGLDTRFKFVSLELHSVIDYEEIYTKLLASLETIRRGNPGEFGDLSILLDPGTPPMQTVWFLIAKSGMIRAHLLQGNPPASRGAPTRSARSILQVRSSPAFFPLSPRVKLVNREARPERRQRTFLRVPGGPKAWSRAASGS